MNKIDINEPLSKIRHQQSKSQQFIADKLFVSRQRVSQMERVLIKDCRLKTFIKYLKALDLQVKFVFSPIK